MRSLPQTPDFHAGGDPTKAARIAALRKAVDALQSIPAPTLAAPISAAGEPSQGLSVGAGLPGPGFPCGVLNEVIAAPAGRPAAFAFLFTLMAAALRAQPGPAVLVATRRAMDCGTPYGHGLSRLGLDVGRLLLVDTGTGKEALWAIEETLRSAMRPAIVAGVIESGLDLTQSRRLNLAAAVHATPLALMRGEKAMGTSAAATRWRLASAPAARDRFGLVDRWRWQATLERSRAGRTGSWLMEWDPGACRFCVADDSRRRNAVEDCSFANSA